MKSRVFHKQLHQLQLQLKKKINADIKLTQLLPSVKINKNEYSFIIGTLILDDNYFAINVGLAATCLEMPLELDNFIKKFTNKFIKENHMRCTYIVCGKNIKQFFAIPDTALIKVLMNLKTYFSEFLVIPTYAEFKKGLIELTQKEWDAIETWDKLHLLQTLIEALVFTPKFYSLFPTIKSNNILQSAVLNDLDHKFYEDIKIQKKSMRILSDAFVAKVKAYCALELNKLDNTYHIDYQAIACAIGFTEGPIHSWSTFHAFKIFCEDMVEDFQNLLKQNVYKCEQFEALKHVYATVNNAFKGLTQDEHSLMLFNTQVFNVQPSLDNLTAITNLFKTFQSQISDNINCYENGVQVFDYMMNALNCFKDYKFPSEENTVITPAASSSNPHAFFSEIPVPDLSLTHSTKLEALKQDKKKARKEQIKANKPKLDNQPSLSTRAAPQGLTTNNSCTLYLQNQDNPTQLITAPSFLLPGFKHVFFCYDVSHMSRNDMDFINQFLEIVQRGKLLARDSNGQEGFKIYGLYCLYVKSLSKLTAGHRMLGFAHPIGNSGCFVYRFAKIVSHTLCNRLIADKPSMQAMAKRAQDKVKVSFDPSDFVLTEGLVMRK